MQRADSPIAIEPRQAQIHDAYIITMTPTDEIQRLFGRTYALDPHPFVFQEGLEAVGNEGLIIDDKDASIIHEEGAHAPADG